MTYNVALPDDPNSHFEMRNDDGMNIGTCFQNEHPFEGCKPVTMQDAENIARLWAAAPDLLKALEEALPGIEELNGEFQEGWDSTIQLIEKAIAKAKGI